MGRWLGAVSLLLVSSACNVPGHRAAKQEAQQRWEQVRARVKFQLAKQQYDSGLFDAAIRTVSESLAIDPYQADAYTMLARANLELGRAGSAQAALDAARRAHARSPDLTYTHGVILEQQDRISDALAKYSEAQALAPANVDYLVAEAECLVTMGRAAEALTLLDERTGKLDDNGTIAVLAAHVAALLGDGEGATKRLAAAAVPEGDRDLIAEELGLLLARANRCAEAIGVLHPLVERLANGQDNGATLRALAGCYLSSGEPSSAARVLTDYAQRHAEDTAAQLLLAKSAVASDDVLTALRAIDAVEQRDPALAEARFVRAVIQWRRGELAAAAKSLKAVIARNPRDVDAHCLMGEILLVGDEPTAARAHFQRALTIDPQNGWAHAALTPDG